MAQTENQRLTLSQIREGLIAQKECFDSPPDWWYREAVHVLLDKIDKLDAIDDALMIIGNCCVKGDFAYADNGELVQEVAYKANEKLDLIREAK